MRTVAALVVALAVAAGCRSASDGAGTDTPAAARPAHPQHLFTASFADPKTFNPILTVDATSAAAIADVFDSLVRLNPRTTEIEPALAERWDIGADGTDVTFHLRRGVRWHDSAPLTAADVVFTFDAIYDDRVPNSLRSVLTIDGQRIQVEAVDDHTVRMRLPHPFAPLLNGVAVPIVPRHRLGEALAAGTFARQWGINTPPEQIVGSGPYRLEKYVPAQYLRLVRNPDYWMRDAQGERLPYLAEQTIRIVPNQDTAYLKFLAGELDLHAPRPEEIAELRARSAERALTVEEIGLDTGMLFVTFNRNPQHYQRNGTADPRLQWFTDPAFLQAIAHSIDRQAIVDTVLNGYGVPAASYLSPENTRFYDPTLRVHPYDLDRARALLHDAGYVRDPAGQLRDRRGTPIVFTLNTNAGNQLREKMCVILKQDWEQLGMQVHFTALDFGVLVEKLDVTFDWDAMLMGFTGSVEPHNAANLLRSSGNLHLWHPNQKSPATEWEAEIDRQVERGARALDPEDRRQAYGRIQAILHEQLPMIQTVRPIRFAAFTDALQNYAPAVWGIYRPELLRFSE